MFWGGNGKHLIGTFDGERFSAESDVLQAEHGANCYAAQTWSDILPSDGRRLQIAWRSGGKFPNKPFNQQMTFPCELTLRTTAEGCRLFRQPIREIGTIHHRVHTWKHQRITAQDNLLEGVCGELFDVRAEIELATATEFGFTVRGEKIKYSVREGKLSCLGKSAPLSSNNSRITLQNLVDRTSIEVFGNDGRVSLCSCFPPEVEDVQLGIYVSEGEAEIVCLDVYELQSVSGS